MAPIIGEWEVDGYDALDPLYLACLDERGKVVGGLRPLPTIGLNRLNDAYWDRIRKVNASKVR